MTAVCGGGRESALDVETVRGAIARAEWEEVLAERHLGHVGRAILAELGEHRDALRAQLRSTPGAPVDATIEPLQLLADVEAARLRIEAREGYARMESLVRIQRGLERLRDLTTPGELIAAAPAELLRTLGFSRAIVSRVRGSLWTPEALAVADGVDPHEDEFRRFVADAEIPLAYTLLETQLVRRRVPVLVTDPRENPGSYKPLVEVSRSTSYAAAPIMPTTRVIGFFHVDRFGQDLPVTVEDRDNLWAFAEHFGLIYERAVLMERLETQRARLHELLGETIDAIDAISDTDVRLVRVESESLAAATPRPARSPLDALLSAREQEVLELMASGATNSQISRELVISEGTVKSHVKRILRKLRVDNRAAAVARYLHVVRRAGR